MPASRIAELLGEGAVRHSTQALLDVTLAASARDNATLVVIEAG